MATVDYIGDGGPDGSELRGTMTISGTTTLTSNITIGAASTSLVGFHGVPPVDQGVYVPITVTVSTSVLASRIISLIGVLVEKGICASA